MIAILLTVCLLGQEAAPEKFFEIEAGRKIPLTLLKGVSTKTAAVGDAVYLETIFPVLAGGKVAIPRGSHVLGSVVEVKRAGKVKGRAELRVRLETLILPNGTSREFRASIAGVDVGTGASVDSEGKVQGPGGKMGDAKNVAQAAGIGAGVGAAAGGLATIGTRGNPNDVRSAIQRPAAGAGIGMLAGAGGMLIATLFMRGPDAVLAKGTDVDMVLESGMRFALGEVAASGAQPEAESTESGLKKRK